MHSLLRHFSISSAVLIAILTICVGFVFHWHETSRMIQSAEDFNIAMSRKIMHDVAQRHKPFLDAAPNQAPGLLTTSPEWHALDRQVRDVVAGTQIAGVRLLSSSGLILYSSDVQEIGTMKKDVRLLGAAVQTGVPHSTKSFNERFVGIGRVLENVSAIHTYVPSFGQASTKSPIVELYYDVTAKKSAIEESIWLVMLFCFGACALLYGSMLVIVSRADQALKSQYKELSSFNARLESTVNDRTRELVRHQASLSTLLKSPVFKHGTLEEAMRALTEACADVIHVDFASIWLFNEKLDAMTATASYNRETKAHSSGSSLSVAEHPVYFGALLREQTIASDDVAQDQELVELSELLLRPRNIKSMLDAPIVLDGQVIGVVCISTNRDYMHWSAEKRLFAVSLANLATLAVERDQRQKAEDGLREANRQVEAANRAKSSVLGKHEP